VIWRSHMVLGASSWLTAQAVTAPITGTALTNSDRACGAVIAAGAALLCDIDTPTSRLGQALGPITRLAARAIGRVFGGHRQGTHSIVFCAAVTATSAVAFAQPEVIHIGAHITVAVGQLAALAVGFFATSLAVAVFLPLRGPRAALVSAALVAAGASDRPSPGLVVAAVTTGCVSHLLGDGLTPRGVTPLWPISDRRVSLPLIKRTGDAREHLLVLLLAAITLAIVSGYA
jgi:membrane-bound metal-dependent hydrolase YbcI (DUF457 family)